MRPIIQAPTGRFAAYVAYTDYVIGGVISAVAGGAVVGVCSWQIVLQKS
jgi:hypothetical protein